MVANSLMSKVGVNRMSRNWSLNYPRLFYGVIMLTFLACLSIPFCVLSGCDFYFGSKIVQVLNEGDGGQDGE